MLYFVLKASTFKLIIYFLFSFFSSSIIDCIPENAIDAIINIQNLLSESSVNDINANIKNNVDCNPIALLVIYSLIVFKNAFICVLIIVVILTLTDIVSNIFEVLVPLLLLLVQYLDVVHMFQYIHICNQHVHVY